MKTLMKLISFAGLCMTLLPAFLVFNGSMTWERHALFMLIGTVLWFGSAPFWMTGEKEEAHAE